MLRCFTAAVASLVLLGCAGLDVDDAGTHVLDLEGRVAVLVVDNSAGPEEFDPDETIREGAKFLLSTFSDADNVGLVTVRFPVKALFDIARLGEDDGREKALEALDAMKIGGDAEYYEALEKARELLDVFSAQRDSAVVFLTGGRKRPTGDPQQIRDLMKLFADRGWRFFPVVLMPAPDLLTVLEEGSAFTQGAVFKIERPQDIMSTLVTVAGKINDLWLRRSLSPAPVHGNASRLLMTVTRDESEDDVDTVKRDDASVPVGPNGPGASHLASSNFVTLAVQEPDAGTWSATTKGTPVAEAMFVKPPFHVHLDDEASVKGSAMEGDEISFHLVVEGSKEDLDTWAPRGLADVTLVSEATGKSVDHFPMERTYLAPELRFSGKTRLFTTEPGTPEVFTARLTLVFGEGDGAWVREEFLSFALKPAKTRGFRVEPPDVDLGSRWWDEQDISRTLEVIARVVEPVEVEAVEVPEGFLVEPASTRASLDQPGLFRISVSDVMRMKGGGGEATLKIAGRSTVEEGPSFERTVGLRYRLVKFVGPSEIRLGPLAPGETKAFSPSTWQVVGEGELPFSVECRNLEGPGLIVPTLETGPEGRERIVIAVPDNAAEGTYEGRFIVVPGETGLGNRSLPVVVEVKQRAATGDGTPLEPAVETEPENIILDSVSTGWVRTSFKIGVPSDAPPAERIDVKLSSLRGRETFEMISAQFDMRVSRGPGWQSGTLGPGLYSPYILEVYVSSDLPDDVYEGEAVVLFKVAGEEKVHEAGLPIRISVKRSR